MRRAALGGLAVLLTSGCLSSASGYHRATSLAAARLGVSADRPAEEDSGAAIDALLDAPLDADRAARIALLASPDLRASMADIGEARARVVSALALPNPTFEGAIRFRDAADPNLELNASLDVRRLVLLPFEDAPASADIDAAATESAAIAVGLSFDARLAYFEFVAATETASLDEELVVAAGASSTLSDALVEAGNVPTLDALNERALYEDARVGLASANLEVASARERLNARLGLFGERGAKWKAEARVPRPPRGPIDNADLERVAVEKSLEIEAWKLRYRSAALHEDLARAKGWLPEISAGISGERDAEGWSVGPRFGVSLPLFYQGQGEADGAEAEEERAKQMVESFGIRVRAAARSAATALAAAEAKLAWFEDTLLPLRARIVDETLRHYNAMSVSAFQLLVARRDEIATERAYVVALLEYWRARGAVDALRAGRLPAGSAGSRAD
ncbi:MAG: TolC family protein [Polyangiaceae bacterium]